MIDDIKLEMLEDDITNEINHGMRVSNLAFLLAREAGLSYEQSADLGLAGLLHDIGKLQVSSHLYGRKKDALGIEEIKFVRMHPRLGYEMLLRYDFSDFVLESILYHHENMDGTGYPGNLEAWQIPIGAKILRICDVYTALTSDRVYRKAFDEETAVELMIDQVKNFDMNLFLKFQKIIHEEDLKKKWESPQLNIKILEEEEK